MGKEEEEASEIIREVLEEEGVRFILGGRVTSVDYQDPEGGEEEKLDDEFIPLFFFLFLWLDSYGVFNLAITQTEGSEDSDFEIQCELFLIATGRKPNVLGLGLEVI